jgi:hypothetical protein
MDYDVIKKRLLQFEIRRFLKEILFYKAVQSVL